MTLQAAFAVQPGLRRPTANDSSIHDLVFGLFFGVSSLG
jgi:hypothetical protein